MDRILTIAGREIPARSNAASLFVYKAQFGRDGLRDLFALAKGMPKNGASEKDVENLIESGRLDIDVFLRFLWVFARSANKSIPPFEEWLESLDVAPIDFVIEALPQTMDMLISTAKSSVKPKN